MDSDNVIKIHQNLTWKSFDPTSSALELDDDFSTNPVGSIEVSLDTVGVAPMVGLEEKQRSEKER